MSSRAVSVMPEERGPRRAQSVQQQVIKHQCRRRNFLLAAFPLQVSGLQKQVDEVKSDSDAVSQDLVGCMGKNLQILPVLTPYTRCLVLSSFLSVAKRSCLIGFCRIAQVEKLSLVELLSAQSNKGICAQI